MQSTTKSARDGPPTPHTRARRQWTLYGGVDDTLPQTSLPAGEIEHTMAMARPRLLRLARAHGFPLDTAHEVVQETLLEAWRHLTALTDPTGFHAWLNAICRNVCRRYGRAYSALARREVPLDTYGEPTPPELDVGADAPQPRDIADPQAIDPLDELERYDREILLDRALGYLAAPAREAVRLCYLAELPQREVARQLGLTIAALEARLHRARRQLRQVLTGDLRSQAEAAGLLWDTAGETTNTTLWHETRLWCPSCARHRLRGAFEPLPSGGINLHLRCPGCPHELNSWGHVPLQGMRSFRPAYKRVMRFIHAYFLPGLISGRLACESCGTLQPLRLTRADERLDERESRHDDHHQQSSLLMIVQCPACRACGRHQAATGVAALLWTQPVIQRFLDSHPRSITEPETLIDYRGQLAVRIRLTDISSAARLTLVASPQTLQVLASFQG
jgi:RNA polymerase sigma factor (sigma-70 family)